MTRPQPQDIVIVGGGVVGMSVAFGLVRLGARVTVLDAGDGDFRASRGNFGLTWGQGKGVTMPPYAEVSLESCDAWPAFATELEAISGVDVHYRGGGGVDLCLDEHEVAVRCADYARLARATPQLAERFKWEYLDRAALAPLLPGLGPTIPGGTWSPHDGHCNPLALLRALHACCQALKVDYRPDHAIESITPLAHGFRIRAGQATFDTERLVLAAGLGAATLAPPLGLSGCVTPVRGQVLITERLPLTPRLPTPQVRQTDNGSYQAGETHEHAGLDSAASPLMIREIARRTLEIYPFLRDARLVRAWGALRIMTPDEYPIYERSLRYPGAYNLSCHSGITLSAFHAGRLARAIFADRLDDELPAFTGARFNVPAA